ncbi:polysaccharide deacetylase, putative [Talaromyces stipitatus ATCC 10500]|uniref:Molybdopterin synthase catalytic subunit n=1 Tax=Talaromyces stipitatus (strain ATCC 10500 / CBS 375.48 / QM 6759 / NRRL 1006) TaxID=441959 RepID=B8MMH0_TALSN|nr:polysaccharide deacetylase, putative [Talaromyces stipitatus ATCC 10500]EED13724.1 polysaccharide deacetylase, putative [Talaromyces stipitatus ATCC 10500]
MKLFTLLIYYILLIIIPTNAMMSLRKRPRGFVIDDFCKRSVNKLRSWHGPGENLKVEYDQNDDDDDECLVRLFPSNPDHNYHTQFSYSCFDLSRHRKMFLHVKYSGSDAFTISLYQNNGACNPFRAPFPGTMDSVEASRYTTDGGGDIYVPLSHFYIDLKRASSIAFHGFYKDEETVLHKVEIVKHLPRDVDVPRKLPTGSMVLTCKRPNSFAFGIDDGDPRLAQKVMEILDDEDIKVTFFVVGQGLRDPSTNLTEVYSEMIEKGHQVALHSDTHPRMEGLQTEDEIDDEITGGQHALKDLLGIESRYFRPPYGTIGARMRQRLAAHIDDPYIVNWSVDVEDWLWANTNEPWRQLKAFRRDIDRGGNLVVMHYLTWNTVKYFREFIRIAKHKGKKIMRIDQCMMDPDAPDLMSSSENQETKMLRTRPDAKPKNEESIMSPTTPKENYPQQIHLTSENIYLELTYSPLNTTRILAQINSPSAGANILFLGTTRDTFENRPVSQLSYTSYAPLALKTLTEIARATFRDHEGIKGVSISHRLGVVPVTEASIAIAVSAAHRGPAWRAGEEVLEKCKERLEVWKREEFVGERPEEGEWRANRDTDSRGRAVKSS